MDTKEKRTWAEIDLNCLADNYHAIRRAIPAGCRFMGLVKANGYGHGAVAVARKLEKLGADYLAVACLDEGAELREAGIRLPILILGGTPAAFAADVLRYDLAQTIYDPDQARAFSEAAVKAGKRLCCHIKADTGMSRLGFLCDEENMDRAEEEILAAARLPGLDPEGIFTHFADADTCEEYSRMQIRRFHTIVDRLAARGLTFRLHHCTASAATLNYGEAQWDMVRPGILLYGHHPDPSTVGLLDVKPVMTLKSRVVSVKHLPKGTAVSYGRTKVLERDSVIAAIAVGYGDGLFRGLSNRMEVLLHGKRVKQVGRICMDMCMVDVTDVPDVRVDDTAVVFGPELPLEEKSDAMGTISYELLCDVSHRIPRVYLGE